MWKNSIKNKYQNVTKNYVNLDIVHVSLFLRPCIYVISFEMEYLVYMRKKIDIKSVQTLLEISSLT